MTHPRTNPMSGPRTDVALFQCDNEAGARLLVAKFLREGYEQARYQMPHPSNPFGSILVSRFGRRSKKRAAERIAAATGKGKA